MSRRFIYNNHKPPVTDPTDYIAWWKLENVNDSGPNGYTLSNANGVTFGAGKINNCADNFTFSNSLRHLSISSNLGISGGAVSVCLWSYTTGIQGDHPAMFSLYDSTTKTDIRIGGSSTSPATLIGARLKTNIAWNEVSTVATLNEWIHLTLTYDGTNVLFYRNGQLTGSTTSTGNGTASGTSATKIGCGSITPTNSITGKVDEVYVFNRALTATEVLAIYNKTS